MISQKSNSRNNLGHALFVLLFLLFICAFSGNYEKLPHRPIPDKFSVESQFNAYIIEVQQFSFLKSLLPLTEKIHPKQSNDGLQSVADKNLFRYKILYLRNAGLLIKPGLFHQLFPHYHFIDTDDPPILS
jgi:hypothetical protein